MTVQQQKKSKQWVFMVVTLCFLMSSHQWNNYTLIQYLSCEERMLLLNDGSETPLMAPQQPTDIKRNDLHSLQKLVDDNTDQGEIAQTRSWIPAHGALHRNQNFDLRILQKYEMRRVDCADRQVPFFIHHMESVRWVCTNSGEKRVTAVMLHVFRHYQQRPSSRRTPPNQRLSQPTTTDDNTNNTNRSNNSHNKSESNSSWLMLDIGANAGFYGLLASQLGHRALFFDLQPECQKAIHNAILINSFLDRARVVAAGISDERSSIVVEDDGCDGSFFTPRQGVSPKEEGAGAGRVTVPLYPLTDLLPLLMENNSQTGGDVAAAATDAEMTPSNTTIMMMKVDTEGNEKRVLKGALPLFQNHRIRNAIVEITPCCRFWQRIGILLDDVVDILATIGPQGYGYTIISLHDWRILRTRENLAEYFKAAVHRKRYRGGKFDLWLTVDHDLLPPFNITTNYFDDHIYQENK